MQVKTKLPNPDTTTANSAYVTIGRFGKTYGVKGWIKIQSYTEPTENILNYSPWFMQQDGQWVTINLETAKAHGNQLIAKLDGFEAPETVRRFTNVEIAIPRDDLPLVDTDENYLHDLLGLTVLNQEKVELGKIARYFDNGAQVILDISGEKRYLLPFVRENVILSVDLDAGIVHVEWDADFTA